MKAIRKLESSTCVHQKARHYNRFSEDNAEPETEKIHCLMYIQEKDVPMKSKREENTADVPVEDTPGDEEEFAGQKVNNGIS